MYMLSVGVHRGQSVTYLPELELRAAPWMMGTKAAASARVANANECSGSSPGPISGFNDQWETIGSQRALEGLVWQAVNSHTHQGLKLKNHGRTHIVFP